MNLFKRFITNPVTHVTLLVVGAVVATALVTIQFFPPQVEGVAPPRVAEQRSVAGVCSLVITGYGGELWAGPLHGGELRRVDPADVGVTGCRTDPDPSRR